MKLFVKILLFVFTVLIANINVANAAITFLNIQETTTSFSFQNETSKTICKIIKNDEANCCQNGQDLVDYRSWGISVIGTAAKGGYSTIYRAVSQAELDDIANFGFRIKAGGYESGKLFAPTLQEATQFGKYNFGLDGIPNIIMKVRVPNSVLNGATKFGADGMNTISIPANHLNLLRGKPLNYSPLIR